MAISYRGTVSRGLFLRSQWLHMGWRSLILLAFPAIFIVLISIGWNQSGSVPLEKKMVAIAISFLWPVLMLAFFWWQWLRIFRKSPYLREPLWGTVSAEALEIHGATGDSKLPWKLFIKERHQNGLILLYQSPVLFNILAREFVASDQEWADVSDLVLARIGNKTAV